MKEYTKIKEGCVTIKFADSKGKQCITFVIDFGETDIEAPYAARTIKDMVNVLRTRLGLKFPKVKED